LSTIGDYTVTFDEQGASIARKRTGVIYRIIAVTATNAIDFMRHHRLLCFAMMNNRPEEMAAYKLPNTTKADGR
jgi:hypothetical protein